MIHISSIFGLPQSARFALAIALAVALFSPSARADRLIGVDDTFGLVVELDRTTGDVIRQVEMPFEECLRGEVRAMARHPGTGVYYVLFYSNDDWGVLSSVDPATGAVTNIARVGGYQNPGSSPSMTFGPGPNYPLYLIAGADYNIAPGTIYQLNLLTGAATPLGWTTSGDGAHAIEFNRDDGMLYHFFYTDSVGVGLEKIDPSSGNIAETVSLSGALDKVNGLAYAGGGIFYTANRSNYTLFQVTTAGAVSQQANTTERFKALCWDGTSLVGIDSTETYRKINPATGAFTESASLLSNPCFYELESLARNPLSGEFFGLAYPAIGATSSPNQLLKVNPVNGAITPVSTIDIDNLCELFYDSAGNLYGLAGREANPDPPNTVQDGTIVRIDPGDGTTTEQMWMQTKATDVDHSIALNPGNQLLYHVFKSDATTLRMETIDPNNGSATAIGDVLTSSQVPQSFTFDSGLGAFFLWIDDQLYRVATDGTAVAIGSQHEYLDISGLAIADDLRDPNAALKRELIQQSRKLKKQLKKARRKGQVAKAKRLSSKLKKLKKKLRRL